MAKPKLHELLAVESDADGVAKKVSAEAKATFAKRTDHFMGQTRTLESLVAESNEDMSVHATQQELTTTVADKMKYLEGQLAKYWDVVYKKECANGEARADIVVGETTIATAVPATFLLGLEKKLQAYREVCTMIPTLQPGVKWVLDPSQGEGIYKMDPPEKKFKTEKEPNFRVLYDATDHHPAQIDKWDATKNVGIYTRNVWSGMISTSEKSELLGRIDNLLGAVKQARRRANGVEVTAGRIAQKLFDYIHAAV